MLTKLILILILLPVNLCNMYYKSTKKNYYFIILFGKNGFNFNKYLGELLYRKNKTNFPNYYN